MKYEEAYCTGVGAVISFDQILGIYRADIESFAKTLYGKMYCPGCRKVALSFVGGDSPHLRGKQLEDHEEFCDYGKKELTAEEVKELFVDPAGEKEIMRQMNRLVIQFLHTNGIPIHVVNSIYSLGRSDVGAEHKKQWKSGNVIPRKSLNTKFSDNDYGVEKLFHGRVNLEWEKGSDRMKLLIRRIDTDRMICRLGISEKVYGKIPKEYKDFIRCNAYMVFAASLSKISEEKSWSQGTLRRSSYLTIFRVEDQSKKITL